MLKIEETEVVGWKAAIRGMRNPLNSWGQSDSGVCATHGPAHCSDCIYSDCQADPAGIETNYIIGPNDHGLMEKLRNAGTDHRKFMRMVIVYLDITAPLYWWKEFKTYRAGRKFGDDEPDIIDEGYLEYDIEMNSCSTMHKIAAKEFTLEDFSHEHLLSMANNDAGDALFLNDANNLRVDGDDLLGLTINVLNYYRGRYVKTNDKRYWWQMIQLLPSSYNQKRTVMLNYEVLANIYKSRRHHKLDEWHTLCDWIESLPYSELITGCEK